jgi:hypothetical protein
MRAFVSYSWDSEAHKEWVRRFADVLIENGVDVTLDQYDLVIGVDRFRFMERAVNEADVVLVICTPQYVKRANERERGVGTETSLIGPKFFSECPGKELIPIIRSKEPSTSHTPDYMSALYFADFRDDTKFDRKMEDLLRHVHRQPRHIKPPLGPAPHYKSAGHFFLSHPFSSRNRERIADISVAIAEEMGLRLSFSHVPTQALASRSRVTDVIGQSHGFIAIWDDSRHPHAFYRPWNTFEFQAAELNNIPVIVFCHSRFRDLIEDTRYNTTLFSEDDLDEKLKQAFFDLMESIQRRDKRV